MRFLAEEQSAKMVLEIGTYSVSSQASSAALS